MYSTSLYSARYAASAAVFTFFIWLPLRPGCERIVFCTCAVVWKPAFDSGRKLKLTRSQSKMARSKRKPCKKVETAAESAQRAE